MRRARRGRSRHHAIRGKKVWPKVLTGNLFVRRYLAPSRLRLFGYRLKVPNGWIYCNTITRARVFARDEFSQSIVFVPDRAGGRIIDIPIIKGASWSYLNRRSHGAEQTSPVNAPLLSDFPTKRFPIAVTRSPSFARP